jgi:hypothetical protein
MRWKEKTNTYRDLVGTPKGNNHLEKLGVSRRIILK